MSTFTMQQELERARCIKASLGVRRAAGFMRNKGWALEAALYWLVGRKADLRGECHLVRSGT